MALVSCTERLENPDEPEKLPEGMTMTISVAVPETVVTAPSSRASLEVRKKKIIWDDADRLSVFLMKTTDISGQNTEFKKVSGKDEFIGTLASDDTPSPTENTYFAFHPYSHDINRVESGFLKTVDGDYVYGISLEQTQNGLKDVIPMQVPLLGKGTATGLQAPSVNMKYLAPIFKVSVENSTEEPLTITSIKVSNDKEVAMSGNYKVDVDNCKLIEVGNTKPNLVLSVTDGTIGVGQTGTFYLLSAPFTLTGKAFFDISTGTKTLKVEKSGTEKVFKPGVIYNVPVTFKSASKDEVITVPDWMNVTSTLQKENKLVLSPEIQIYKCPSINGQSGNVGWAVTVPSGKIDMEVIEKNMRPDDPTRRVSSIMREDRTFGIFIPVQGPGVWQPAEYSYYSSLAYGKNKDGQVCVLRADGWGGKIKSYAPALAVSHGVASMENASAVKGTNEFKKYSDVKGNGGQNWIGVDAAFGGYFQIVKDGKNLISGDNDVAYKAFSAANRPTSLLCNLTPSWKKTDPIELHDALRTGRMGIGCTEKGDLIIFMSDKYVNTHNQGQGKDKGHDGTTTDTIGVTLYELAEEMIRLGCSDVMTMEDYNWSYVVLQKGDGDQRGYDLVHSNSRWNFGKNEWKAETSEIPNLFVVRIK